MLGLINQGSVQHQHLLSGFDHRSSYKSKLERIRRFFAKQLIDPFQLCYTVLMYLYARIPMMDVALDRTNWKFGKKDINFLVLSARISKHIVFPIGWSLLDHQGNSDANQRIELLDRFQNTFGFNCIRSFAADREFIGNDWIHYLCKHNIPFLSV